MAKAQAKQIIVVDDDIEIHELMTAFFKPRGYNVVCFADCASALAAAKTSGATWDVLLSDLNLPEMSGVDFSVKIKQLLPNMPVILVTTSKNAMVAIEAVKKGVYDFIVKPIHFPQLQISVERALHVSGLHGDITELRERIRTQGSTTGKIIGRSPKFVAALDVAKRVARSKANIFISGESGTGKEVFAKVIHDQSGRNKGPFVAINCSAIPENLLESELFGHAKGAFTGAQEKKIGLFEEAEDGTLFLDEIGDLPLSLQAKLLRVLQERKIKRVGENQYRPINCRIISATHKDLKNEIREGRFREDLFFRLDVIPIALPPLRERKEDILPLAESFLRRFALENESIAKTFSKEAIRFILNCTWRGNVRELENAVERAVVLSTTSEVGLEHVMPLSEVFTDNEAARSSTRAGAFVVSCTNGLPSAEDVLNQYIEFAVAKNDGARDRTAKEIGVDRKTLYKRLKKQTESSQELQS